MNDFSYTEAVRFLFGLQRFGVKLGLERIDSFLDAIGNPQEKFKSVHVAGTNGKGSTCFFLGSILASCGLRVGLYTSPHIFDFDERVIVDGKRIDRTYVADWIGEQEKRIRDASLTFFEATTALAFSYFAEEAVDMAVCEVGLGGRLDATNVLHPAASVITTISYDHQAQLGPTIADITREKLGIMKRGVPVITGETDPSVIDLTRRMGGECGCEVLVLDDHMDTALTDYSIDGSIFSYTSPWNSLDGLKISMAGTHQVRNAALALFTLETCFKDIRFDGDGIRRGLEDVKVPGRLQVIETPRGVVVLDVAHNVAASSVLVETLKRTMGNRKAVLVIGMSSDKDSRGILETLSPITREFIVSRPDFARHERRAEPAELYDIARRLKRRSHEESDIASAVSRGLEAIDGESYLLVTGSFFTVSEAVTFLTETRETGIRQGDLS